MVYKYKDQYVVLLIPSRQLDMFGHKSLNLVMTEDGTMLGVFDKDLVEIVVDKEE